jgi:maltose-binding protein MalE
LARNDLRFNGEAKKAQKIVNLIMNQKEWQCCRSRMWAARVLLWGLLVGVATACSTTQPSSTPLNPLPVPVEQRTTLVFWHAWPSPEQHTLARLVDTYNQEHPETQVLLQAMPIASLTDELRAASLVGSGPHLVLLQNHTIGALAQDDLLLPLDSELFAAEEREALMPTALAGAQAPDVDGTTRLYGLPLVFDTLALYYHRGSLEEPPATTDELLSSAHSLTDISQQPPVWGLAYTLSLDKTVGYLPAFGGRVFDAQGNVVLGNEGRAGTERWLQWLLTLRQDDNLLATSDSIAVDSALKAQEALMTIDWAHALADYRALWGDDLGIARLPRPGNAESLPRPYVQSDVLSINARVLAHEQRAALDFARYLLGAEAQQALFEAGRQPSLLALPIQGETPELRAAQVFRQQALQGQPMPNNPLMNGVVRAELIRMQQAVLQGVATPADAVTAADTVLRERLGEGAQGRMVFK